MNPIRYHIDRIVRLVFGFKYFKLVAFAISLVLAYEFFTQWGGGYLVGHLGPYENVAAFIGGLLYAFGFTSAFGAGIFLTLSPDNFLRTAVAGGLGAMLSDLLIERFVRVSFKKELEHLSRTNAVRFVSGQFNQRFSEKVREYVLLALAGIFIASPLPDELGVSLLAGFTNIKESKLAIISFALNTVGIMALLLLGYAL